MAELRLLERQDNERTAGIKTWRYLRVAIVVLAAGLVVAVGYQFFHGPHHRFLTSISAYYYTPVHAYFVGALVSIGVCLFCVKGNTDGEDILLNLAGIFAPLVAFVPTPDKDHSAAVLFSDVDIKSSVTNNITALLVIGAIGLIALAVMSRRHRPTALELIGYGAAVVVWVATLLWFEIDTDGFVHSAHFVSASLMFACIIGVVWFNALSYKAKKEAPSLRNRYLGIAIAMAVAVVAMLIAGCAGWDYWLLALESMLLSLFAGFWGTQTAELWRDGLR
jgi:hypothetical protein